MFSTLGATLVALDAGVLSIPSAIAAKTAWTRLSNRIAAGEFVESKTDQIRMLT